MHSKVDNITSANFDWLNGSKGAWLAVRQGKPVRFHAVWNVIQLAVIRQLPQWRFYKARLSCVNHFYLETRETLEFFNPLFFELLDMGPHPFS